MGRAGLVVSGVSVTLGGRVVVDGLSFQAPPGHVLGILGPNGAGKSSCFRYLAGLVSGRGAVSVDGRRLDGLPLYRRARAGLGYVPQGPSIFPDLSVADNLRSVADLRLPKGHREPRVAALLDRMGLSHRAQVKAGRLSGGERRRLELARAILPEPACLLLDEPFAALDPRAVTELQGQLRSLAAEGLSIALADHRVEAVLASCDQALILFDGRAVAQGTPEDITRDPQARRLYFGTPPT